jgi:hypothetical protein
MVAEKVVAVEAAATESVLAEGLAPHSAEQ